MKRQRALFGGLCLSLIIIIENYIRDWANEGYSEGYGINDFRQFKTQVCVQPDLSMWKDFDINSVKNVNVRCGDAEKEWVYTGNGKFYISSLAVKRHGEIKCTYTPIQNLKDRYESLKSV